MGGAMPFDTTKDNDFILINSAVGGLILLFLSIAAFHIFAPEPLWLAMQGSDEYFNPQCLTLLIVLIPLGSLTGCLSSYKRQGQPMSWFSYLISWFMGCIIGGMVIFPTTTLLGVLHPLLLCGLGLALTLFVFCTTLRKERAKPSYIKLPM
jgi:hypothetical protein